MDGPFLIMLRSSGEKKTMGSIPSSSLVFLMGIPSMAIPFGFLSFK